MAGWLASHRLDERQQRCSATLIDHLIGLRFQRHHWTSSQGQTRGPTRTPRSGSALPPLTAATDRLDGRLGNPSGLDAGPVQSVLFLVLVGFDPFIARIQASDHRADPAGDSFAPCSPPPLIGLGDSRKSPSSTTLL
jgi:hypothetical protein